MTALRKEVAPLLRRSAIYYASLGFVVFPTFWPIGAGAQAKCSCGNPACTQNIGKHPLYKPEPGWDICKFGYRNGTDDLDVIEGWWERFPEAGIGLVTGRQAGPGQPPAGSGYIVLDIDKGTAANGKVKDGDYELEILQDIVGRLPETWTCVSGSGGGRHLYFKHPGGDLVVPNRQLIDLPKPETWTSEAYLDKRGKRLVLSALQIRGDGGYVLAPPSRHKSGRTYSWEGDLKPGRGPCAEIPPALLEAITRRAGTRPHDDPVPEGNYPPLDERIKRAKAYINKMPEAIQGEHGSTTTFSVAMRLVRGFALPQGVAYDILAEDYNPRCVPQWSADELSRKIDEALVKGQMEYGACFRDDDKRAVERELARMRAQFNDDPPCNEGYDGPSMSDMVDAIGRSAAGQLAQEDDSPPSPPEPPRPPQGDGGGDDDGGRIFHEFLVGDHVEVAEAVVEHLERGGRTVIHEEGAFWRYAPGSGVWEKMEYKWVEGQVQRFAHSPIGQNVLKLKNSDVTGIRMQMASVFQRRPSALSFLTAKRGIAFRNGFLRIDVNTSLRTAEARLLPHAPANMARHAVDASWSLERADAPKLRRFMDTLFIDVADKRERENRESLVQEYVGASMAGVATTFGKALFLHGPAGNGKSALLEMIQGIFPKSAVSAVPPEVWNMQFQAAGMVGALINLCDDIRDGDMKDTSAFKKVVTGGLTHLDVKHGQPLTYVPTAGNIFCANDLPLPKDSQEGFWRRCIVLPLTADLLHRPDLRIFDAGKDLAASEPLQIIQWAVDGLMRLIRNGGEYTVPDGSVAAATEWKSEADPVHRFLLGLDKKTVDELNTNHGVMASVLWNAYTDWVRAETGSSQSRDERTSIAFSKDARKTGFIERHKVAKGTLFLATQKYIDAWTAAQQDLQRKTEEYEDSIKVEGPRLRLVTSVPPRKEEKP